jgi:galactokinase/mevalonate kinase-like predicted kinase
MNCFDVCIITASNPKQAESFRRLIDKRKTGGIYPREIDFFVCSDPEAGRIGSGGGTVRAVVELLKARNIPLDAGKEYYASRRVLIIHAGGESRRLPAYMPEGKLFAPVPVPASTVVPPVILDVLLTLYLRYPWSRGELIVSSGDVVIDFDTDQVQRPSNPIVGFSAASSLEQGSRHGVFAFDPLRERVIDYYQKAPVETLKKNALLEGSSECALDIGLISLTSDFTGALIDFAQKDADGGTVYGLIEKGALSFDIYLEVLTACLARLGREEYGKRVASRSRCGDSLLDIIYDSFSRFDLGGVLTRNTRFHHFGSLEEFPEASVLMNRGGLTPFYSDTGEEYIPEWGNGRIIYNSAECTIGPAAGGFVFVEGCRSVSVEAPEGGNAFFSLSDFHADYPIPQGVCIDERENGVRLVYSVEDDFKSAGGEAATLCGTPLSVWCAERGLAPEEIWEDGEDFYNPYKEKNLLTARLFFSCSAALLPGYWTVAGDEASLKAWRNEFLRSDRFSIQEMNERSDVLIREAVREECRKRILKERILSGVGFRQIPQGAFLEVFGKEDCGALLGIYEKTDDPLIKAYRRELVGALCPLGGGGYRAISFVSPGGNARGPKAAVKADQIVWARSPVRLDLAGGWTDTPPYTNREGGSVVNVAVDLNGQPPIQVFVRPTADYSVRFHSIDLGVTEPVDCAAGLENYADPSSPFALAKAAAALLLREELHSQQELLDIIRSVGSGFELTLLCAVPKGSGLGTSSVLAGTILAALHRFFGMTVTREELFLQVLEIEQMLTTGGGWQDQIGGLIGGVKYIETKPGMRPKPVIHQLDSYLFKNPGSLARLTLFYTGITRLAKNILQEVVAESNGKSPAYLYTLRSLKRLAYEAKDALSLRDMDRLAEVVRGSWEANKLIHYSSTNDEVERLLEQAAPYSSGMKLFGAGGGGFGMFISPTAEEAGKLREVLLNSAGGGTSRVLDMSLNEEGLVVTVS